MLGTLSGRFLILTIIFVMLAEVLIFVPSIARFREDYLRARLDRAQIASLALLADDMLSEELETELLQNAGVYNVALRRDEIRQLVLSSPVPAMVQASFDLREAGSIELIRDALARLIRRDNQVIRVIGQPSQEAGDLIEVSMDSGPLRAAMLDYGLRILWLSAVISALTAILLFGAVRVLMVLPIKAVVHEMMSYADAPEDARRIITPRSGLRELREAEEALGTLERQLTSALRQKERLAQLGGAVARISHDLRNILSAAQLFTTRIEASEDPAVRRLAPKLVGSITRAISLCETTLAFGRAEEPAPALAWFDLSVLIDDLLEAERLAIGEAEISLSADIPAGLMLRGDPEQIYRVLSNLLRNARQALTASRKPGEICIRAHHKETDWVIEISDTGPGLPARARAHLFEPFQGGVRKGGSGLGLAIAFDLIRGHGGTLRLKHSDEQGSCFVIHLPMGEVA